MAWIAGWRGGTLAGMLLLGCAPGGVGSRPAGGEPESYAGTVQVVGSAPMNTRIVLEREGAAPVGLAGPLAAELATLSGARVSVHGTAAESPDPMVAREIDVAAYEIVSINGGPVIAGEVIAVEGDEARLRTADGAEVRIIGAPRSFRVGQKVWVQGPREVTVQSYGTLRP